MLTSDGLSLSFSLNMVGRSVCLDHLESCGGRMHVAGRVTNARQVEGRSQMKGGHWSPLWGLGTRQPHLEKQEVLGRTNRLLSFDTPWTAQKKMPLIILHCCRNVFTVMLPSNDRGIHRLFAKTWTT
jgi:hypothetical protein